MNRFFILGCQRSGTTLVRLILECHPKIFCFDEWNAYKSLKINDYNRLLSSNKKFYGYKIPRWTEKLNDGLIFDPGDGVWMRRFYRGEPIIFLLRDVRDTVTSMFRLKAGSSNWWTEWGDIILGFKMRSRRFVKLYCNDLPRIEANPFAAAALYWKFKTQAFFEYRDLGWPVYGLRYEDLVRKQEVELKKIVKFLGLMWDDRLLHYSEQPHREIGSDGKAIGDTDPNRPIDTSSIGTWRNTLPLKEVKEIMAIAGEMNNKISQDLNNNLKFTSSIIARFVNMTFAAFRKLRKNDDVNEELSQILDWLVDQEKVIPELRVQIEELKQRISNIEEK